MGLIKNVKNYISALKNVGLVNKAITASKFITDNIIGGTRLRSFLNSNGKEFYTKAYEECSVVQSVIAKKANAITRGEIVPVDKDGNKFDTNPADFSKAMELLNNPNAYQTKNQFLRTIETLVNVYGACYVYEVNSVGFKEPTAFIPLPNECVDVQYKTQSDVLSNNANEIVDCYIINIAGYTYTLKEEDRDKIYLIEDSTIQLSKNEPFEPQSRLDSIRYNVENIVSSQESRNVLITKRGAEGIISPDRTNDTAAVMQALNDKEKERIQKEYSRYGTLKDQWHTLITKVPMKYTSMTKSATDLGLLDGEDSDARSVADSYGVPTPLIGLEDNKKYNNYTEAQKDFYDNTIIPESSIIAQSLDEMFKPKGWRFYFDYSNLQFMQESKKDKADVLQTVVSTLREAIEINLVTVEEAKKTLENYK